MTPPETPRASDMQSAGNASPAVSFRVSTLRKRSDFLLASRAKRAAKPGFVLQGRKRRDDEPSDSEIRIGYTCSKKVGNAVARNRAKRRLREIARLVIPEIGNAGWDYVLIGRRNETAARDFQQLLDDLEKAVLQIHKPLVQK